MKTRKEDLLELLKSKARKPMSKPAEYCLNLVFGDGK
jgi:hypothetical protein